MGQVTLIQGDIGAQRVDAQVNAWNRNVLPWFLLLPQGVSRSIRKSAGWRPFWHLWLKGPIPTGQARVTDGGRGPAKYLIHAAGLNLTWRATSDSVRLATDNAIKLAFDLGCRTAAFPLIGAGTGGVPVEVVVEKMAFLLEAAKPGFDELRVVIRDQKIFEQVKAIWPKTPPAPKTSPLL